MLGERCDHPNDHESDHTYPDTHSLADSGFNPCSLGSLKRGCRERSRGAGTMIQTTMLGARFHVPYTSACPNAGWEARLGERSSLHCQAVLPLCLSHYIVMVMGLLQPRSDTLFFFITELIIWTEFHIALLLILPVARKWKHFIPKLHLVEKAQTTPAIEKQGSHHSRLGSISELMFL